MSIKPALGRVLIKRCEPETKSGGIIIPETAQEKSSKGEVLAIGPFEKDKQFDVKVGDTVHFAKWAGTELKSADNDGLIIIKADEILGIERE